MTFDSDLLSSMPVDFVYLRHISDHNGVELEI